jgi:hypothetical protein
MGRRRQVRCRFEQTATAAAAAAAATADDDDDHNTHPHTCTCPCPFVAAVSRVRLWGTFCSVCTSVWWGTSLDTTNKTMCGTGPGSKSRYTNMVLGPVVKRASEQAELCAKQLCNSHGTCWLPPPSLRAVAAADHDEERPPPAPAKLSCDCDMGFEGVDCNTQRA